MYQAFGLFFVTAFFEIFGCYGMLKYSKAVGLFPSVAWFIASISSLLIFAWLLSYHPTDSGRIYATYGGVYVFASLLWMWVVDKIAPTAMDYFGIALILAGTWVIAQQFILTWSEV